MTLRAIDSGSTHLLFDFVGPPSAPKGYGGRNERFESVLSVKQIFRMGGNRDSENENESMANNNNRMGPILFF
jgi:hypothetical protein